MSREDLIDLEFFTKLLFLKFSGLWDLDHDARMDLIDKGDASSPDPVHTRKLALDIHVAAQRGLTTRFEASDLPNMTHKRLDVGFYT